MITEQAARWKFAFPTTQDHDQFRAVQAAAKFLQEYAESFPPGFMPNNPTQQAVVALKVYKVFLPSTRECEKRERTSRTRETVEAIIAAYERFEAGEDV